MARDPAATRTRILDAAETLFYGEGIRTVGVDAIAAQAGVTKRTLYQHFPSKDALIAAYVEARDGPTLGRYRALVGPAGLPAADQLRRVFAYLAGVVADGRWKGCGFVRAVAELAGQPGHPALAVAAGHKKRFEAWLESVLAADGVAAPATLARQVMILLDGTVTQSLIHRDPAYADAAAAAALALLDAARRVGDAGAPRRP
ncbi:MAG: TetR/AcrR family transcriptional regulator [Alphaproteobacteria bacterium]|nr:TetR/AcrR family transcriptional regulator [Alphaproteobacteria bacterium]